MFEVGEFHFEAMGAASVIAEVHLAQSLRGDLLQLVLGRTLFLCLQQVRSVVGRQGQGEVAQPRVISAAGAAVKPNRARVSITMPPVVAAVCRALALICGCQRARTSRSSRSASCSRGV